MQFNIPEPLTHEHEVLHQRLHSAKDAGGAVAEATDNLIAALHPHFVREEEIAMPPLALLLPLSKGEYRRDMDEVLELTDALSAELPRMLEEHAQIRAAAQKLADAAKAAGRDDIVEFCDDLGVHARTEEEVLYPAALLVGELVRRHSSEASR
ncbi:hemerythrin domain-containing protein [Ectothiorhodospiraceae bacterium WFHF3C12]|nr:hemerythrin domain-containing protein [Ectothiorhodospiraceae bacterium WFHF3C12]